MARWQTQKMEFLTIKMAIIKSLITGFFILSLIGCDSMHIELVAQNKQTISKNGIQLTIPKKIFQEIERGDGSFAFPTYDPMNVRREPNDYSIYLYSNVTSCSKQDLGISILEKITTQNADAFWGHVDAYDNLGIGDLGEVKQNPECIPPTRDKGGAYVLCAEKDGRNISICITQQTNNPKLAEDIFSTFRWTE